MVVKYVDGGSERCLLLLKEQSNDEGSGNIMKEPAVFASHEPDGPIQEPIHGRPVADSEYQVLKSLMLTMRRHTAHARGKA